MKSLYYLLPLLTIALASCGSEGSADENSDSASLPDSVPQVVRIGSGDYAYKPDTAMNELVLGDAVTLKKFMHDNGNQGQVDGKHHMLYYLNALETEFLTVFTTESDGNDVPYGFRLVKNMEQAHNEKRPHNTLLARNILSGHGVYIGMPPDFVQSVYKSQPMTRWVKKDTTYLAYSPEEKDKKYFQRYQYTDYSALYKFVDDKCRVIEMWVDPAVFEK